MSIYGLINFGTETTWSSIMGHSGLYKNSPTYVGSISEGVIYVGKSETDRKSLTICNRPKSPTNYPNFKSFGAIHLSPQSNFPEAGQESYAMIEVFGVIENPSGNFDNLTTAFNGHEYFGCGIAFVHENE